MVGAFQAMVTRRVDVFDPAVVTVARIQAGTTSNVIPETAELFGTVRTVSEKARDAVLADIERVASGLAAAHGATAEISIVRGYPVTVNDVDAARFALDTAGALLGEANAVEMPDPVMGAEDWSYVLQQVPGAMAFLGTRPKGVAPHDTAPNHSNRMVLDEDAMAVGIATYAGVGLMLSRPLGGSIQHGDRAGDRVDLHLIAVVHPIEEVGHADDGRETELARQDRRMAHGAALLLATAGHQWEHDVVGGVRGDGHQDVTGFDAQEDRSTGSRPTSALPCTTSVPTVAAARSGPSAPRRRPPTTRREGIEPAGGVGELERGSTGRGDPTIAGGVRRRLPAAPRSGGRRAQSRRRALAEQERTQLVGRRFEGVGGVEMRPRSARRGPASSTARRMTPSGRENSTTVLSSLKP